MASACKISSVTRVSLRSYYREELIEVRQIISSLQGAWFTKSARRLAVDLPKPADVVVSVFLLVGRQSCKDVPRFNRLTCQTQLQNLGNKISVYESIGSFLLEFLVTKVSGSTVSSSFDECKE